LGYVCGVRTQFLLDDGQGSPVGGVGVVQAAGLPMNGSERHKSSNHGLVRGPQGGASAGQHAAETSVGADKVAGDPFDLAEPGLNLAPEPDPFVLLAPDGLIEQRRCLFKGRTGRHEITGRLPLVGKGEENRRLTDRIGHHALLSAGRDAIGPARQGRQKEADDRQMRDL